MGLEMRLECPRCKRILTVSEGTDSAECNCHLYCSSGDKPADCALADITLDHEVGYPYGMHTGDYQEGDDVLHRVHYCGTHGKYIYKTPIIIPVDWSSFMSKRAPTRLKLNNV